MSLSPLVLRTGGPSFLPHSTVLKAGNLSLLLEQGEVRRVRLGDVEILRRIYLAVRGSDWRTIPPVLSDLKVDSRADSFDVSYVLTHRQDEFDFAWTVTVTGDAAGRIAFEARGRSASAFATNRVGMCVLHPPRECAGREVRWIGPDGAAREGRFPSAISPHEPFKDIAAFSHELEGGPEDGTWVDLAYAGETFEMEDQRNWTDGSFKTYCPPAHLPKPRKIEPGWETVQGVTLTLRGPLATAAAPAPRAPALRLDAAGKGPALPALGLSQGSHGRAPGTLDIARLRALAPAHLRANFRLAESGAGEALERAAVEAAALGTALEAALVVGEDVEGSLSAFADAVARVKPAVSRWLVFHSKSDSTPLAVYEAARRRLGALVPGAAFALGSKNDFVLLNRGRPALDAADPAALAFAMCPQVHAFDNRNVVEALEGQGWTLRTAREAFPGRRIAVSTLSIKRTPFAASLKLPGPPPAGAWLNQADPRQLSLFGAGWTLASVKCLALQGAASATVHETTGPLGVLAGETLTEAERNFPGMDFRLAADWAFPVWHALADLAEYRGGYLFPVEPSHPLRVEGLGLASGSRRTLLVANLEETAVQVRLEGLPAEARLRRLDESSAIRAVEKPEEFRREPGEPFLSQGGSAALDLKPFAIARLDWA